MQMTRQNLGEEKAEGVFKDVETLAMFLAASTEVANPPRDRLELLTLWMGKRDAVRAGYLLRAKRLLAAWGVT